MGSSCLGVVFARSFVLVAKLFFLLLPECSRSLDFSMDSPSGSCFVFLLNDLMAHYYLQELEYDARASCWRGSHRSWWLEVRMPWINRRGMLVEDVLGQEARCRGAAPRG